MNNIRDRVTLCFSNVFTQIRPDEIPGASTTTLPAWDSLAHVRLLNSIEEEFSMQLEMEDFEEWISYPVIVECLEKRFPNA